MCETKQTGSKLRQAFPARLPGGALLAALLGLLPVQEALASCTATMQPVNFGNIDVLNPQNTATQARVSITFTTSGWGWFSSKKFNVCLAADGGRANISRLNPRQMCLNGSCASGRPLTYNLYTDPNHTAILGSPTYSIKNTVNTIVAVPSFSSSTTVEVPIYAKLVPPFSNTAAGRYSADFSGGSTLLLFKETTANTPENCTSSDSNGGHFSFTVSAAVTPNCTVSEARNLDFGEVRSTDTNLQGQSSFKVTCTNNTPYKIGLQPSNNNPNGQGEMRAVQSGNPDKIPYQLRSSAGMNGNIWGNTATADNVGNGVAGTGTGTTRTHSVHATINDVGSYRAGEYRDKVIINVHY